jgi:aminoglycoside phosphotransferase (APT) family kinase protein
MTAGTPEAEHAIDAPLVRALLSDQHADLAGQSIRLLAEGWDNAMFRLGDDLLVRLPRRQISAALIVHEQTWLPRLAERLAIPIPAPVRVGLPGRGYPWRWSVVPWIAGRSADQAPMDVGQAGRLADFLLALHTEAPADAPENPVRGVPLESRAEGLEERLERLRSRTELVTREVEDAWEAALAAPPSTEARWLHGDLHAQNVLVDEGEISGVIDWGDVTAGDVATDLACVWMLLDDRAARDEALSRYAPSDHALSRAKGWAVLFGAVLTDTGRVNNPRHAVMGEAILKRIAEDARPP